MASPGVHERFAPRRGCRGQVECVCLPIMANDRAPLESSVPLRIIVADDHNLVRDGLKLMLSTMFPEARFFEAGDAESLLQLARRMPTAQLALIDLNMPGMDKGVRLGQLWREYPKLPLVVVSALTSPDVIRRALEIPTVYAFVAKSATAEHMRLAIEAALRGEKLPYAQSRQVLEEPPEAGLTPRMEEVRALLRRGMTNKAIAATLGISEGTVKNYMTEIFRALQVSNRTQAARYDSDSS